MDSNEKVFAGDIKEDAVLESLGYQQELKRSFGLLGMIGFSFSIVTSWTALGGVLIVGVESGGPPVMIWSWIGICIFSLAVAYSMAEMCSAYPVAGGQYSWVAILAPPKVARGFSWITGWFMITGTTLLPPRSLIVVADDCDTVRHPGYGCNQQFHRSKLHSWPSKSFLSILHDRTLAYGTLGLSDCTHQHHRQHLWPASA